MLVFDNCDSFTDNDIQCLGKLEQQMQAVRNDQITLHRIREIKPERILVSPDPCSPLEASNSNDTIRRWIPISSNSERRASRSDLELPSQLCQSKTASLKS